MVTMQQFRETIENGYWDWASILIIVGGLVVGLAVAAVILMLGGVI